MVEEESLLTADAELFDDDDDDDLFIKPVKKHKILMLSDHPLAPSGVGVQSRVLIDGLLKTGRYSFRCLGGAIKHKDYNPIQVTPDFIIKPVDGFGDKNSLRQLLITERPDAILIFTDPRQFIWLWEMEDEIHQICPITYWHVWDNGPYPAFNRPWYEGTDLINCLSHKTYELVQPNFPEKTNYIPHAFSKEMYFPLPKEQQEQMKVQNFGEKAHWFKALWVNRNATRKMPSDLLEAWKVFLGDLQEKHGHQNAVLIMHTDPTDVEGPNLLAVSEMLNLQDKVWFSTEKLSFQNMNMLHNITDTCVNISKNEGFGLSTLISMQVGKPVIALKTGGETRKVVDHRDGSEHGVALDPVKRLLVGSQLVPYIYEDYVATQDVADAFMKIYEMTDEEKDAMAQKCKDYVDFEFNIDNVVKAWDESLTKCIEDFQKTKGSNRWTCTEVNVDNVHAISNPIRKKEKPVVQKVEAPVAKKVTKPKKKKVTKRRAKTIDPSTL